MADFLFEGTLRDRLRTPPPTRIGSVLPAMSARYYMTGLVKPAYSRARKLRQKSAGSLTRLSAAAIVSRATEG